MSRPGVVYSIIDTPVAKSAPTDTATGFMIGVCERGSTAAAVELTSVDQFVTTFGDRLSYSSLYDAVESFFAEGGSTLHVARVVGPSPVYATENLFDMSGSTAPGDVALVATAKEYGTWGNGLTVEVEAGGGGGTFVLVVADADGELERSGDLADRAAAVTWSASSDYITITLGASAEDPRVQGPTSLASGTDDSSNVTATQAITALGLFDPDLGPGQVAAPGVTTSTIHEALLDHASTYNRRAIIDGEDTATYSDVVDAAEALSALDTARYGAMWGGAWPIINGLTASTTRTVPPSGVIMGMIARNDASNSPNQAVAGVHVLPRTVIDLSNTFSAAEHETLNDAEVNAFKSVYGQVQNYGFRSLALKDDYPSWYQFSASRLLMAITAKATATAQRFLFSEIDGQRTKLAELEGAVKTEALAPYYPGSLYGNTSAEAYSVDATSVTANTDEDIANGDITVLVAVRVSPFAEYVQIVISNTPITGTIA